MKSLFSVLMTLTLSAADNPMLASSKAFYDQFKGLALKSADKLPEEKYSFRPTPEVRTFGQLLAHIADAQYILCGIVRTGKPVMKTNEKTAKTKAEIVAAMKDGFAYCDAAYAELTDADASATVIWFGEKRTKLSILDFNVAHGFEHYGNLVTYMRMQGAVPPSSEK